MRFLRLPGKILVAWRPILDLIEGFVSTLLAGVSERGRPLMGLRLQRNILAIAFVATLSLVLVCDLAYAPAHATQQDAKIELSLSHRVLRDDFMVVSGRLSTVIDDRPIPLVKVRLQYYRSEDTDFTREVTMITSNPGGLFEDRFNTTTLLRIGTWCVNASFPSQLGYESASTVETFTIVVQPALSLYMSSHEIVLGQNVDFNGLLFACIPCIEDEVTVTFIRPDNTSISTQLRLAPTGGPYPGGYYEGTFTPDGAGRWRVEAVWKGNEAMLPAYSQGVELNVKGAGTASDERTMFYASAVAVTIVAVSLAAFLLCKHRRRDSRVQS